MNKEFITQRVIEECLCESFDIDELRAPSHSNPETNETAS